MPLLFKSPDGWFEVLTWVESRNAFCQGTGGFGSDRYLDEDLIGFQWASLIDHKKASVTRSPKPR